MLVALVGAMGFARRGATRPSPLRCGGALATAAALAAGGCGAGTEPAGGPSAAAEWLADRTATSGLRFDHSTGAEGRFLLPEIMGGGAALFDYDRDGDLDVYMTNGNRDPATGRRAGGPTNRLYRHDTGLRFVDVTAAAGVGDDGYGMGVAVGDFDNDGHADLYVTNYGPDRLYRNRGDGAFDDVTAAAGIDVPGWSASAAFLDYDRDGDLDLYVTQYVVFDSKRQCFDHAGRPDYCGPEAYLPATDVLLRNSGDGSFRDVSAAAGITAVAAAGLGVVCEDFDGDGWIDVYVANDAYENQLWLNGRDGTFRDVAIRSGVAYNLRGQPEAGMGVLADDLDGDGGLDLFVTHLDGETNTFYRAEGNAVLFLDESGRSGLGRPSLSYTGFGTCAFDVELDGDLDVAVANGRVRRGEPRTDALGPPWNFFAEPNLLHLNDGAGHFRPAGAAARSFCATVEISRALAAGDLDRDGDVDLVLANVEGPARVYLNEAPRRGRWLRIGAVDPALRRPALGARVTVRTGRRVFVRAIRRASGYLSSHEPVAHFGLGTAREVESVDVRWPDGATERFAVDCVDCAVELRRGQGMAAQ